MKTYNLDKRISVQAKTKLQSIIDTHNKYKNCYCWIGDNGNNNQRNHKEKRFYIENSDCVFIKNDKTINVKFSFTQSRKNTYYSLLITVNNEKKNITVIKNLFNKKENK